MVKKITICLCLTIMISAYGIYENSLISETEIKVEGQLKDVLRNKVVVQLSDLHIGSTGKKEKELLSRINTLQPDIIFLTGDYVKWNGNYEPAMEFLSQLSAKIGIWAVMGDYDYSNSRKSCLFCHKPGSGERSQLNQVKFLKNSSEILELNSGKVQITGVDDFDENLFNNRANQSENDLPEIILSHNPLNFDLIKTQKEVLMLSGDTHGGQIPLPKWLWHLLRYKKNEKYNYGLYEDGKKKMYVSRGFGTSHVPVRLFCPPEIVVLKF